MRSLLLIAALTPQSAYRVPVSRSRAGRIVAVDPNQVAPAADTKPEGVHGSGFRFMPMVSMQPEPSPALLAIAGAYPGITADQLLSPSALPQPDQGRWNYHRLTGDAVPTGFVVVPGEQKLHSSPNTVAVVCDAGALGIDMQEQHEVLALIDRSDVAVSGDPLDLEDSAFYAFADESGAVTIRWVEVLPAGWRVLGKLLYTILPNFKRIGKKDGFAELDDDFEF